MMLVVQEYGQDCPNKLTNITKRGIEIAHIAEDIQKESKTFHLLYI
jgi:hypothetical protein